jgi:peptidoglycan/LPS O-acetylase OafA/YrhL
MQGSTVSSQERIAGFATISGAMLLATALCMAFFLAKGVVPPFFLVMLPSILGAGLLAAGLVFKRDNGWNSHSMPPERRA